MSRWSSSSAPLTAGARHPPRRRASAAAPRLAHPGSSRSPSRRCSPRSRTAASNSGSSSTSSTALAAGPTTGCRRTWSWSPGWRARRSGARPRRADREAAAQALGHRHHVRLGRRLLVGPQRAGPPHAGLHLVEDQQQPVTSQRVARGRQELGAGRARRPRPGRLDEHGRDGSSTAARSATQVADGHNEARHDRVERLLFAAGRARQRADVRPWKPSCGDDDPAAAPVPAGELDGASLASVPELQKNTGPPSGVRTTARRAARWSAGEEVGECQRGHLLAARRRPRADGRGPGLPTAIPPSRSRYRRPRRRQRAPFPGTNSTGWRA